MGDHGGFAGSAIGDHAVCCLLFPSIHILFLVEQPVYDAAFFHGDSDRDVVARLFLGAMVESRFGKDCLVSSSCDEPVCRLDRGTAMLFGQRSVYGWLAVCLKPVASTTFLVVCEPQEEAHAHGNTDGIGIFCHDDGLAKPAFVGAVAVYRVFREKPHGD